MSILTVCVPSGRQVSIAGVTAMPLLDNPSCVAPIDYRRWVRDLALAAFRSELSTRRRPDFTAEYRTGSCGDPQYHAFDSVVFGDAQTEDTDCHLFQWLPYTKANPTIDECMNLSISENEEPLYLADDILYVKRAWVVAGHGKFAGRLREISTENQRFITWDELYQMATCPSALYAFEPVTVAAIQIGCRHLLKGILRDPNVLAEIHHRQFEELVAVLLSDVGLDVVELTQNGRDGGMDIVVKHHDVATRQDELIVIECKHWTSGRKVSLSVAATLQDVRQREAADTAILLSSSGFSPQLLELRSQLEDTGVYLRDSHDLGKWIRIWERTFGSPFRYRLNPRNMLLDSQVDD
jgi:hypothetical protein